MRLIDIPIHLYAQTSIVVSTHAGGTPWLCIFSSPSPRNFIGILEFYTRMCFYQDRAIDTSKNESGFRLWRVIPLNVFLSVNDVIYKSVWLCSIPCSASIFPFTPKFLSFCKTECSCCWFTLLSQNLPYPMQRFLGHPFHRYSDKFKADAWQLISRQLSFSLELLWPVFFRFL